MVDATAQALAIYELMCLTSDSRPFSGNSIDELNRAISTWQEVNPALTILRESEPAVHLAFLRQSYDWLKANGDVRGNFRLCHTLTDGVVLCLRAYSQPFPPDLLLDLVSKYRHDYSMARFYFPFDLLLSRLTRDQITNEVRAELRKIHLQLAPSPTGKIQPSAQLTRDRLADLTYVEGEKQLDPGRGPWSQIVFDEIKEKEPIVRSAWEALLEHCKSLQQPIPSAKWNKRAKELLLALGESEVMPLLFRWVELGPTPGQPPGARSPIEDSQYQKGIVWCLAAFPQKEEVATLLADFGIACLHKIRMAGAVSQKVGLACVQALGTLASPEAIAQLTRLRTKIKYSMARKLIEKSLQATADKMGMTRFELEDFAVDEYGLDRDGSATFKIGDAQASLQLFGDGRVGVAWQNAHGKVLKAIPAGFKKNFSNEVRSIRNTAKELEQAYRSQKLRLEASLIVTREMRYSHWRKYFLEHNVLGFLGRRLIWVFRNTQGGEQSAMWINGDMRNSFGEPVSLGDSDKVRLWHPLSTDTQELQRWRDVVFKNGVYQPFRQAFREVYEVGESERETRLYSNRFAGVLMRQHQFASLCKEREWDYRLMGAHFDGFNVPTKKLDSWKMHAEFYVDLPSDRKPSLRDSALAEESAAGINMFIGSDQVRFYREEREISIEEVPALVYSEIMRDIDLFTSVCAVGDDETWTDQGDRGIGVLTKHFDVAEITAITSLRADILSRVLPHTRIANQCRVVKSYLEVRGQLGTYQIQLGWCGAALITDTLPRWLKIPQKVLSEVQLDITELPIELDYRTELALKKAYVLADDWKIKSPELVQQLMPR